MIFSSNSIGLDATVSHPSDGDGNISGVFNDARSRLNSTSNGAGTPVFEPEEEQPR